MRTKIVKIDVFLAEKMKLIDTDFNEALRKLMVMLYNEAFSEEVELRLKHNAELKARNEERLNNLQKDIDEEYGNAEITGMFQLKELEYNLSLLELQKDYPKLLNPSYEFESVPRYLELRKQSILTGIESTKKRMELLKKGIDVAIAKKKTEFENRKILLEEQNKRLELELIRAKRNKENLKVFEGLIDGIQTSANSPGG